MDANITARPTPRARICSLRGQITAGRLWRWAPHVVIGMLAVPFIVRQNSWYEWTNALWLLELQTEHVRAFGAPTYFIDAAGELFYPQQLFYAGPMISVLAYPSVVIGAWPVFAATTVLAFCSMSAGVSWVARNLGVHGSLAVLPGLAFASTPYIVSDLYGRGDWAELVAVAGLAIALGAGTSLGFGRCRSEYAVLTILALSTAIVAGTHNITLLFGGMFAILAAGALSPAAGPVALRGWVRVLAGCVVGLLLCGMFLIPDAAFASRTYIAATAGSLLTQLHSFDRLGVIFNPFAAQPREAAGTYDHVETLVALTVWCAIALAAGAWKGWLDRRSATSLGLLGLLGAVALLLVVEPGWWLHFPPTLQAIQFPFRLVSYVALTTVLASSVLLARPAIAGARPLTSLLAVAVASQLSLGVYLAISANPRPTGITPAPDAAHTKDSVTPASYPTFQQISYRIFRGPQPPAPAAMASISRVGTSSPATVNMFGSQPIGTLVSTPVVDSPLIRVTGDASVAETVSGLLVLRVTHTPWRESVSSACSSCLLPAGGSPRSVVAGHWASILGALALLGLLGGSGWEFRQRNCRAPTLSP